MAGSGNDMYAPNLQQPVPTWVGLRRLAEELQNKQSVKPTRERAIAITEFDKLIAYLTINETQIDN